ncbi:MULTISPECIES: transketolase family protein [unclassified Lentimicrobium]|uniref:transketolase family protein n=1 Tax=unclassified Lentimicrobium TaxID=2677434 RepID=UPI001556A439|nr:MULTISPECIES: transketolase C-terminal domain-containing protein [unclassified Lentimicrobium]NPD46266.1 transketolase family protein [Lentimicrobium sp. S6]NPD83966.1 transketolase family protein [Lentimicrobium sp. L6]
MKYSNLGSKATRFGFGEGLKSIAEKEENIIGLGSDITSSVCMNFFADAFPERFYSLGIAEQNAIGVAAGLALSGKLPVFATYAVFAALRTTDQIRISLCYNNVHAIIGGAHAGISVGPDGATHQALEDLAIMRVLPNMTVLSPCDANQAHLAVSAAVEQANGPVYIRYGREAVPNFTSFDLPFEIGKAQTLVDGDDITIIATGHMVWEALVAVKKLKEEGVNARVINMHTIKPLDEETIIKAARETGAILTVEEHQIHGGLGSAVAEVVSQNHPVKMKIMGMPDCFGESGQPEELLDKYWLTSKYIIGQAIQLFRLK